MLLNEDDPASPAQVAAILPPASVKSERLVPVVLTRFLLMSDVNVFPLCPPADCASPLSFISDKDPAGNCNIEIRAFPGLAVTSSTPASCFTHVVRQDDAKDLIFVEGTGNFLE